MAENIKRVELQFREIDSNLDCIASRLNSTFKEKCTANLYGFHSQTLISPVELMHKVSNIRTECNELAQELQSIQLAEQDAVEWLKSSLPRTVQNLMKLQLLSGSQLPVEKPDVVKHLEDLIGVQFISDVDSQPADKKELSDVSAVDDKSEDNSEINDISQPPTSIDHMSQQADLPSNIRRRVVNDFVEIDEKEYSMVSDFIKQRVKLFEVNIVYRQLWRHFKQEGHSAPLSSSEMFKLGLRVTGRTGQSKLKILQSLKLISLSNKGDVKLL